MKKLLLSLLIGLGLTAGVTYAANSIQYTPDLYPLSDSRYYSGTTTKAWLSVISDEFCLTGDSCITSWLAGGGGGSTTTIAGLTPTNGVFVLATGTAQGIGLTISTTSPRTITLTPTVSSGYVIPLSASTTEWSGLYDNLYSRLIVSTSSTGTLFYVSTSSPGTLSINYPANVLSTTTAAATYEPILTKGNLTATSPLQFDNTRQVIGGAAAISVASGYVIPLSASTTEWHNFHTTPSGRITAGNNLTWSGNQIDVDDVFPTYTYASSTFPSFGYATSTFPSFSYASSTFPSFSYATTTFPTFSYASSTFPSFGYATSTFVTYGYATNTFATIASYPTYTYASSSYFTLFNTVAGSNIVITTSTALKTIAVSSTPTFTSVSTTNASTSHLTIAGSLYDSYSSRGALGEVLQSTATSTKWVATSTLGISGSLSGGSTGKVALWANPTSLTTGLLLDGTVSGVNATSSTVTFNLQGSSNVTPFSIASSTGHTLLQVHRNGSLSVGTTTSVSTLFVQGTSTLPTLNIFQVASSSGTSYFTVANNGSTTLSSLTAGPVYSTASGSLYTGAASGGSSTYNKSYWPVGPFQGANSTQITGSSNQGVCNYFTQYNTTQTSGAAFYVSVSSGTSTCSGGTCGFQIGIYNSSKTLIAATEVGDSATSTATANIRTPTGTKQLRWLSGSAVSAGKMTLSPGNYWMCYSTDSTAMFVRTWGNINYEDILQAATIDGNTGDKHGYKGSFSSGNGSSLALPSSWSGTLTASGSGAEDLQVYFYK